MTNCCANCRFFEARVFKRTFQGVDTGEKIEGHGVCRRHAPTAGKMDLGIFPIIAKSEWCGEGEFSPKAAA